MFKRYSQVFIWGIALPFFGVLFYSQPAAATSETYVWTSYSKISAKDGSYKKLNTETANKLYTVEFTQDENNPHLFKAKPGATDCEGELTLLVSSAPNNHSAQFSSTSCGALSDADSDVTIKNDAAIIALTQRDLSTMYNTFVTENCTAPENPTPASNQRYEECRKSAKTFNDTSVRECESQFNYKASPQLANKFVVCVAEKLCVDRPSESIETADPNTTPDKCAIAESGWILCQMMEILSWVADRSFELLSRWLEVDPLTKEVTQSQQTPATTNSQTPPQQPPENTRGGNTQLPETENNDTTVYTAWKLFLGATNLIFVAVLLLVIISYVTGIGLSSYNLKVVTPRFIAATILVNMSFWICALAVDITNVLGTSVKTMFVDITPPGAYGNWTETTKLVTSVTPTGEPTQPPARGESNEDEEEEDPQNPGNESGNSTSTPTPSCEAAIPEQPEVEEEEQGPETAVEYAANSQFQINFAGAVVAGTAALYVLLVFLVPLLVTVLIVTIVTLLVLMLRQVIIIVLVVVSPIAFALILLPNTKQWFDRWRSTFVTVLMLYPTVSLIYGASYFASYTIYGMSQEHDNIILTMMALAILVLPLIMTLTIMKLGGGIMNKFTGLMDGSGAVGKLKENAKAHQQARGDRLTGKALAGKTFALNPAAAIRKTRSLRKQGKQSVANLHGQAQKSYYANNNTGGAAAVKGLKNNQFAGEALEESTTLARAQLNPVYLNQMQAVLARFDSQNKTLGDYMHMAKTGKDTDGRQLSDVEQAAAAQAALNHANAEETHELIAASGQMGDFARRILVENLRKSGFSKENSHFGGSAMAAIQEGRIGQPKDGDTPGQAYARGMQNIEDLMVGAAENNAYGGEKMVEQSSYTLSKLHELKQANRFTPAGSANLRNSANMIHGNEKLHTRLGGAGSDRSNNVGGLR